MHCSSIGKNQIIDNTSKYNMFLYMYEVCSLRFHFELKTSIKQVCFCLQLIVKWQAHPKRSCFFDYHIYCIIASREWLTDPSLFSLASLDIARALNVPGCVWHRSLSSLTRKKKCWELQRWRRSPLVRAMIHHPSPADSRNFLQREITTR